MPSIRPSNEMRNSGSTLSFRISCSLLARAAFNASGFNPLLISWLSAIQQARNEGGRLLGLLAVFLRLLLRLFGSFLGLMCEHCFVFRTPLRNPRDSSLPECHGSAADHRYHDGIRSQEDGSVSFDPPFGDIPKAWRTSHHGLACQEMLHIGRKLRRRLIAPVAVLFQGSPGDASQRSAE